MQTGSIAPESAEAGATTWRILEAVAYLNQCRASGRGPAVLTGESAAELRLALQRFVDSDQAGLRVARVLAPTDSRHAFLQAVLAQLGFEPFDASADDLQRLLHVVLRQSAARNTTTVILVEDAHQFGPRVLELIRDLIRESRELEPAPLLVLTGSADLHRVLDSKGMASLAPFTRHRFDLAGPPDAAVADAEDASGPPGAYLLVSLEGTELARIPLDANRILIGRGPQCDVTIASRFVSRQHALLLRNPDGDWILDLKSTNGTSVNSQLVQRRRLAHGDVVSLGNHRLRYHNPGATWSGVAVDARPEQLSDTLVMRSLQALTQPADEPTAEAPAPPASGTAA